MMIFLTFIDDDLECRSYEDRIYTTNAVGFGGIRHIAADSNGKKDYSAVVAQVCASHHSNNQHYQQ